MIRHHLRVAFRNIFRQRGYSLINIAGLATGIVSCMLILLYVTDELSYDRFHEKGDRIYRVLFDYTSPNGETFSHVIGPYRLADELAERYPEIELAARLSDANPMPLRYGEREFVEDNVMLADSTLLDLFTFHMLAGDPSGCLREPFTCMISDEVAEKFFGAENPVGNSLVVNTYLGESEVTISGVYRRFPDNSHVKPDMLVSMTTAEYIFNERQKNNWGEGSSAYYVLLPGDEAMESLNAQLPDLVEEVWGEGASEGVRYWLQPLYDTHLRSSLRGDYEPPGNITTVIVFSIVALFILIIATINYMNLSTARSARRAREVGVRKLVGGQRRQLIWQFQTESVSMVFFAMVVAFVLAHFLLPTFNNLSGKSFNPALLFDWRVIGLLLLATLVIGLLAGSYPSFVLSAFKPMRVLFGDPEKSRTGFTLRRILVVVQFSISIALIISTLVVYGQWKHLSKKDLGINPEGVVIIPRPRQGYEAFKQEVLKNPAVMAVTSSNKRPTGRLSSNLGYRAEGMPEDAEQSIKIVTVDFDFFETMQNRITEGRSFSRDFGMDSVSTFILNETAVRDIGWEEPIGKWFETSTIDPATNDWKTRRGLVVGVAEDFHFESVHNTIQPVVFFVDNHWVNWMSIRISMTDTRGTLSFLESEFEKLDTRVKWDYSFYSDEIAALYTAERQFLRLFIIFSLLAILIASLGILGLASFSVEQRTREIGIRKVAGSNITRIIMLISKEFLILILVANLIAWPLAWYFMRNWLMDFPYRISLGIPMFLLAGTVATVLGMVTVILQGLRAANMNPAEALRYE